MTYETNCTLLTMQEWLCLMRRSRRCSYRLLVNRIKKELPHVYDSLALQFPNPYADRCRQTDTHYILVLYLGAFGDRVFFPEVMNH